MADTNLEVIALDPDALGAKIAGQLIKLTADATSSELVYWPGGAHSFYRDAVAQRGLIRAPGFEERLARHGEQMVNVSKARRERERRLIASGAFEFRVEPDRVDGTGGYFSPPAWLNQLFATANRPRRILADLMPTFPLPSGVSQVNVPILTAGSSDQPTPDDAADPDQDITDAAAQSTVALFSGEVDAALQLLEQSPAGAHLDWAMFMDLSESYDASLEAQLLVGTGLGDQLLGVVTAASAATITITGTPTGSVMYPFFGQVIAQIGDNRLLPPQCWLMRTARWAWIKTSEDSATLPFDIGGIGYLGSTDDTPDPIGGIAGFPVFLDDAIPNTLGAGTQDLIIALRPHDGILLEGEPQTLVAREPLSGNLGVRLQLHGYAAALTGRRPAGIGVLQGPGMVKPAGF
jgi:hypothetical protein